MNYDYPDEDHGRWKAAAEHMGQSLKEWIRRALNEVAERQRVEQERKRR